MANVRLNSAIDSISGRIGGLVFKRYGDGTILARMPDFRNLKVSDAQKAVRENFRRAAWYGKTVMADPQAKAKYEEVAKARKQPLFSLMLEDFLRVPSIDEIDLSAYSGQAGEKIFVRASDDFDVVAVHVTISKVSGESIESGTAVKTVGDPGRWLYTTTASTPPGTAIKVEVGATDRPGHTGTKVETK